MSDPTPINLKAQSPPPRALEGVPFTALAVPKWEIREATLDDVTAVARAVADLLVELGGTPAPITALEEATRTLVGNPTAGALLVADAATPERTPPGAPPTAEDGQASASLVGVLGVSWQHAVRIPGRYGLIQELWVRPSWRSRAIGGDLLDALSDYARALGISRLEVGLPGKHFAGLTATEAFYLNNGFTTVGVRMRRLL